MVGFLIKLSITHVILYTIIAFLISFVAYNMFEDGKITKGTQEKAEKVSNALLGAVFGIFAIWLLAILIWFIYVLWTQN